MGAQCWWCRQPRTCSCGMVAGAFLKGEMGGFNEFFNDVFNSVISAWHKPACLGCISQSHHSSRQSQQWADRALGCFSLGYLPLNTNYLSYQSAVIISLGAQTPPQPTAQSILRMNSPNLIDVQWHRALVGSTEPHQQGVHPAKHRAIIWNKFNWIKFWLNAINMIDLVTYPLYDGLFNLFFHSEKGCCIDPKH